MKKVKNLRDYSMAKRIRKNGTAMMGRWPVLKYNEIGDIMCLEHRNHLNGVVVDDAALEVMLRIEKTMQRLEALCDEGVGVVCDEMARLLRIAEETDWVGITPGANKYSYDETVGNESRRRCLPLANDGPRLLAPVMERLLILIRIQHN